MKNTLRSEWIKLRTVRMNWWLFGVAVALPLLICSLIAALRSANDFTEQGIIGDVAGTVAVAALLMGIVGAATITGEFGFNLIRPTFAATPRRMRVLVAKAVVTALTAAAVTALVTALCFGVMRGILAARNVEVSPFEPYYTSSGDGDGIGRLVDFTWWHPIVGIIVFAVIVSLLGYALGLLTHNTIAAVATLLLWPLLIEGLIGGLLFAAGVERPERFLPYQSGFSLVDATIEGDAVGRVTGGLYFGGVTLALAVIGALLTNRRDA